MKLRLSHFIFEEHSRTIRINSEINCSPSLSKSSLSCKKQFRHFLQRWAGMFVNKNLLCMLLLHKSIAVSQSDLKDRNLLKVWMNSINWNTLTWEKMEILMLSAYLNLTGLLGIVCFISLSSSYNHLSLESLFPGHLRSPTIFMQKMIQQDSLHTCWLQGTMVGLGLKRKIRNRKLNKTRFLL